MKVDQHISELLYDHDCVIVPSFGGFLASYAPARIHPTQHTLSPPSKKIAFNVFLKQNDGLLANHISGQEKLSYNEALVQIEQYVNRCQGELAEGRKLVVERIGTFYFDSERNLQFDPVKNINYLRDAFGLGTVQYLPVKREDQRERVEKQLKEINVLRPSVKQDRSSVKLSDKVKHKILRSLIVAGSLLYFSFHLYLVTPHRFSLSSLNPFSSGAKTEVIKKETKPEVSVIVPPAKVETVYVAEKTPEKLSAANDVKEEKKEASIVLPSVTPSLSSTEDQKYFVIAGAFEFPENAEAYVKTLQSEGFKDARILNSSKRLKMVCFKGFSARAEAVKELDNLKALHKDGWIYAL